MDRRQFLQLGGLSALAGGGCAAEHVSTTAADAAVSFQHGVASGDPLPNRVILWTRVTPPAADSGSIDVRWWIGEREDGANPRGSGTTVTSQERDYTVKVDVAGLEPGKQYFYGFSAAGAASRVGRTRTAPVGGSEQLRFAVTSCANYPQGYFNAYREIADSADLTAVLSLGDYIYEYANGEYGDGAPLGRVSEPVHEIVSLRDYRLRHAQHKAEQDLQDAHAAHPWIVVWDDHESANNAWSGGAENHDESEGSWTERRAVAVRAYYEWMPIREVPTGLFRSFRFGDLVDLVMLDTRLEGRDEQGGREDLALANNPERQLLGPVQESLFFDHLTAVQSAGVRWKLVGQQVVFAPWTDGTTPFNPDSWDGYRAARDRVLDHIESEGVQNVVILTGDVHSAWGMEVPKEPGGESLAIELVTPAVSSPPLASVSESLQQLVANAPSQSPHIKYADGLNNGYVLVDVQPSRVRAEWRFTGPRDVRNATSALGAAMECRSGSNRLG